MLEPPQRGGSNKYPQSMFWIKNKKKKMYTRVYPSFTIQTCGIVGDALIYFRDVRTSPCNGWASERTVQGNDAVKVLSALSHRLSKDNRSD